MYSKKRKKDIECKQVSAYVPFDVVNKFDKLYPHLRSVFLMRCLQEAILDKLFFDRVFFGGK